MNTREKLSEIKEKLVCLVPRDGATSIITSHEYSVCDCRVKEIITELEKSLAREALAREALEFYADFAKKEKHQFIFDDETSSRAAVYERYKEYSIGDLGVKAHEALAKMDSIK